MFVLHCSAGVIIVLVWIDDILVGASSKEIYDVFVKLYKERFPSEHHQKVTAFAGLCIDYKPGVSLSIHQKPHIERAYTKFLGSDGPCANMVSGRPSAPANADRNSAKHYSKITLAGNDAERAKMKSMPYLPVLATLMFITNFSLPSLIYHTSFLGQFMHDPSIGAMEAVLTLLAYAYFHRDEMIIVYAPSPSVPSYLPAVSRKQFSDNYGLHGYSDASWLLRSIGGYIVMMMGGPIDWGSKCIRVICHSSSEAEISAGCWVGKRSVFIIQLLEDMHASIARPFILFIDNTAAMDITERYGVSARTAHFLRWQHYLRYLVFHNYLHLIFVGTKDQLADICTKVLDPSTFHSFSKLMYQRV